MPTSTTHSPESRPAAPVADGTTQRTGRTLTPGDIGLRHDFGRILTRAITSARSSQRLVAQALGISRSRLAQYLDGESAMRPEHLLRLPPRVLAAVAEQLACAADTRSTRAHGLPIDTLSARLAAEVGDVARAPEGDLPHLIQELEDVVRLGQQGIADARARMEAK